jgi:hypothetical protein
MSEFSRIQTGQPRLEQVQDAVARALHRNAASSPWSEPVLVENVTLTKELRSSVAHNLGREPRGWQVVRIDTWAMVREDVAYTDRAKLALIPTDTCIVSLLVW